MSDKNEQRICIKFCVKNDIKCSKVVEMMQKAFGDSSMNERAIYKWHRRFKDGRISVADDDRAGRPSTSTSDEKVEEVKQKLLSKPGITIREVAQEVGISYGSCKAIIKDIKEEMP